MTKEAAQPRRKLLSIKPEPPPQDKPKPKGKKLRDAEALYTSLQNRANLHESALFCVELPGFCENLARVMRAQFDLVRRSMRYFVDMQRVFPAEISAAIDTMQVRIQEEMVWQPNPPPAACPSSVTSPKWSNDRYEWVPPQTLDRLASSGTTDAAAAAALPQASHTPQQAPSQAPSQALPPAPACSAATDPGACATTASPGLECCLDPCEDCTQRDTCGEQEDERQPDADPAT
eukprot:TRINITY_DN5151_c0_g1_i3.p1 TRINITY_DN5151_c0_g1~~TRINITY_DN5151_c0_g1_i3.p1  ORF type:complete len:249 (-),score=40.54 TRINITY_DN5151_c0_g1_i3:67-765(-)